MIKVGIIGHTGRLGKPLVKIMNGHHRARIAYTESRGEGSYGNPLSPELFFLALPRGESVRYLKLTEGRRVIDLSDDHRTEDGWVYGIPELNRDKIRNAQRVSNPGCYATSIILGLAPIVKYASGVCVSSTSGISGAGMEVQKEDNFLIYKEKEGKSHQHLPEIEKMLGMGDILFVPQRIDNTDRGIVSTIFGNYSDSEDLVRLYYDFYLSEPFVRIKDRIETKNVNGTNYCDIEIARSGDRFIVISALDNLIKGGAGQAVQNFNLMYGLSETAGLRENMNWKFSKEISLLESLTRRELEILRLASEGYISKDIGKILSISKETVKNHFTNIYDVLNLHYAGSRVKAVKLYLENREFLES